MRARILAALMALVCIASPLAAQETRGSIEGIVKDASGGVLPGVTVEAKSAAGTSTAVTDASGVFRFPSLAPGTYELMATLQGFKPAKSDVVELTLGQVLKLNLALELGALTESVQITAESPLIDVKNSAAGQNINAAFIDRLPKGRDFTSLVTLAAGANEESRSGGISIDGASASENQWSSTAPTRPTSAPASRASPSSPTSSSRCRSSRAVTRPSSAARPGGVVNVVTKSGSNLFHGDVGILLHQRLDVLQRAADAAFVADRPEPVGVRDACRGRLLPQGTVLPARRPDRQGPSVVLRRLHAAARRHQSHRHLPLEQPDQLVRVEGKDPLPDRQRHAQATNNLRMQVRSFYSTYKQDGRLPAKDGSSNFADQLRRSRPGAAEHRNQRFGGLRRRPQRLLEREGGVSQLRLARPRYSERKLDHVQPGSNGLFPGATNVQPAGYNSLLTNSASIKDMYQRISVAGDGTYFANLAGDHALKGGVPFERIRNNVESAEQHPRVSYRYNASRTSLNGRVVRGTYGYYSWRLRHHR